MTDNEIVKALEWCKIGECRECAKCVPNNNGKSCRDNLLDLALDLINRQKAEIERCKGVIKILENDVKLAGVKAVKNFAHYLIDRSEGGKIEVCDIANFAVEYMNKMRGENDGC